MRVLVKRFTSNESNFVLLRNRKVITDLSVINRVTVTVDSVQYDSNLTPLLFNWADSLLYQKRINTNYLGIQFGLLLPIIGTFSNCTMLVYFDLITDPYLVFDSTVFVVEDL